MSVVENIERVIKSNGYEIEKSYSSVYCNAQIYHWFVGKGEQSFHISYAKHNDYYLCSGYLNDEQEKEKWIFQVKGFEAFVKAMEEIS